VDVVDRHREDEPPRQPAEPAPEPHDRAILARADDVIAVIDGVEQGVEMGGGPGLAGRGHQDERLPGPLEPPGKRLTPVGLLARHDDTFDPPSPLGDQLFQRMGHAIGRIPVLLVQDNHPDGGIGERVAPVVGFERVEGLINGRGHSASRPFHSFKESDI
jgi:hypothetical protein